MEQNETFKDWLFRYQHIYRLRRTNKQKQRFLSALFKDIAEVRQDIQVIEYQKNKRYISSNLYVGNIEKADRIICTYYDTPPQSLGAYYLFDRRQQRKATTNFILISLFAALIAGLLLTIVYMKSANDTFDFRSFSTLLVVAGYGLYFYLLSKIAKGLSNRKTLIRNSSSILSILTLITEIRDQKTAFAFVDEGCFGDVGLEVLQSSCRKSAKIYYLDCVGAEDELHFIGSSIPEARLKDFIVQPSSNQVTHIFSGKTEHSEQGERYYLEKSVLNSKTIQLNNLKIISKLFK
ncbi:hypothetical protein [Enterococcus sp. LJL51]|uniref:hypothetical protein n=1 Tax=Enterococcus sp. LJL51 TaxID=3416656 RepID=UPI003CF923FA